MGRSGSGFGDSFSPKRPPKPRRDLDNLDGKKGHRVAGFHGDQPLDLSNEPPSRNHRIVRKNPGSSVFGILGRKTPGHICKNILVVFTVGVSVDSTPYFCLSNLPMTYDGLVPRCPKVPCESHAVDPSCWVLSKHRFGCPAHVHRLTLRVSHPHKLPATFFEQKNTLDNTHTHNHTRTHIIFESLETK